MKRFLYVVAAGALASAIGWGATAKEPTCAPQEASVYSGDGLWIGCTSTSAQDLAYISELGYVALLPATTEVAR